MEITFRKGTLEDLNEINAFIQKAIIEMETKGIHQWDEKYPTLDDFKEDILSEQLYVGVCNEQLAVVYVLNQSCDEAYMTGAWKKPDLPFYVIHRLCVNPLFQHQGLAKKTMAHIHNEILALGITAVRLDVFSENPYALALYDACGYQKVGEASWRKGKFYLMETYLK